MASGRHDYRDPAKEKFGKPTTSYDEGSLLHPKLTDVLASRKDSTSGTTPFLTPHDKLKETVLTSQSSTKGDDDSTNAQLVYETLPGPVKVSFETDSRTKIVGTIWEQLVAASDNPPDRGFVKGGIFQMTANFANGNTVTIGAITYTAQTTLTNVAGHFLIASTLTESLLNLAQAIIAGHGSGTRYAAATTENASCSAWSTQDQLVVASKTGGTIATTTASAGAWTDSTTTLIFKVEYKATDTVVKSMRVVTYSILDNYSAVFANTADINFPEVLTALTVYWSTSIGEGTNSETGSMDVNGTSNVQLGLDIRAGAQGSVSVIPELIPTISKIYGESLPVTDYYFFLPLPVTQSQILSRLTALAGSTVNAWPIFKPVPRTFILDGRKLSASLEASLHYKVSVDTTATSTAKSSGMGHNFDAGSSVRAVTLPPMLNAALSIKNASGADESTKNGNATITSSAFISDGGAGLGINELIVLASQASVTPSSIQATTPSTLPTSGLYLLRCDTEIFRDGYAACRARVFDFGSIPNSQSPVNITLPTLSSSAPTLGISLSTSNGTWTGAPTFTYQWQNSSDSITFTNIGGATSSSYTPVTGDVGKVLRIVVTGTNAFGAVAAVGATSPAVAHSVVNTVAPALSTANPVNGTPLTTTSGTWLGSPTFAYQWQISADGLTGWADITGETTNSYTPAVGDVGSHLRCVITATNAFESVTANSNVSNVIA